MTGSLDDYRWLISADGAAWLTRAQELQAKQLTGAALVVRLRKELSAAQAHRIAEQLELRQRAAEKFSQAGQLFFTKKGLEQATDEPLARYKADRFPHSSRVADLCCGIGGDLMALARRGPAVGIDNDPIAALLAAVNLAAIGAHSAVVQTTAASPESIRDCAVWHCDPDRRASGKRTTAVEHFSPALEELDQLLSLVPHAAIKLAPATAAPPHWTDAAEREWLGSRRECRQQVAWFGALARHPGQRVATIVQHNQWRTVVERSEHALPIAHSVERYVYEPHSAVLAAGLAPSLCQEHELAPLTASAGYLTGDQYSNDLALDAFEVLDCLPLDRKKLRAYCRDRGLGRLEIKKRGVELDPEKLRKEIAASGENEATLIVTKVGDRVQSLVTRRIQ